MSCPYEKSTIAYARFSHEAMDLIMSLYEEYTKLAAEHVVVPSPHLERVIRSFVDLYRTTITAYPVMPPE